MKITNVKLIEIDESKIIELDGVKYLLLTDTEDSKLTSFADQYSKTMRTQNAPYPRIGEVKDAILDILKKHPNSKKGAIISMLNKEYGLTPPDNTYRGIIEKLRQEKLIARAGQKSGVTWRLSEDRRPGDIRGL